MKCWRVRWTGPKATKVVSAVSYTLLVAEWRVNRLKESGYLDAELFEVQPGEYEEKK